MKTWKLIGLILTMSFLSACTAEEIIDAPYSDKTENETGTLIAISMDNLIPVNMNSRTTCIDGLLAHVQDLNIRLTNEDGTNVFIYCSENNADPMTDEGKVSEYVENQNMNHLNSGKNAYIHYNSKNTKFFKKAEVLANYGTRITTLDIWNQAMKDVAVPVAAIGNEIEKCYLYGMDDTPERVQHSGAGSTRCDKYEIAMRRSRAMLTVKIDGTALKEGVTITPTKFSLHNLPASCQMNGENKIATDGAARAEIVSYAPASLGWDNAITNGNSVGVHADKSASNLPDNFHPIYIYENMQGQTNNKNKVTKWPEGCTSIAEAAANETHSYIEIEADYKYEEGGSLKNSGTIIYRFFLGKNDFDDFNVERNTYYKLTLQLKNFGGAKEDGKVDENGNLMVQDTDASWRVDMNIRDWGFEKDAYDFDAHATLGIMKIMGNGWKVVGGSGAGELSFIKFWSGDANVGYWVEPTSVGECGRDGKLYFFIQPWCWNNTESNDGFVYSSLVDQDNKNRRKIEITLTNGTEKQTVTFYQWKPIPIIKNQIYMERFEEDNPFKWGYAGQTINGINDVKLTRKAMWNAAGEMTLSPAQIYCKEKSSYDSISNSIKDEYGLTGDQWNRYPSPSGDEATYCLPDMETLLKMKKYCEDNPHSNNRDDVNYYQPLELSKGYWSVSTNNQKQTYFLNAIGQQDITSERDSDKRVRAIYVINPY